MGFFRKTTEEEHPKPAQELVELRAAVQKAQLPEAVAAIAAKELERLDKTDASVAEYTIGINYLDYLISLPWNRFTEDNLDLKRAERILESQHYGLHHVKERILEYLAVRTLCSVQTSQILVVDDEEIARTNLEYILRKEGHQVTTAANGLEALEKVKAQEFDVVLTDLKMEKMDGIQLLESVKQIAPHTEIVMVTGYATVSSAVDALKKGAAHYLSKPIKLDELRATVREIIDKKRHVQMNRGPVLCFAGPPGTGKTSIGQAIAEALERKFVRLSLAGLRDEAELRGHRRTYVGAMPGRIINELKRLEVKNPVFMLDEIDKIGQDFRGDPASVLLEILDPQQNTNFVDHYVDVPFDLSGVMFITTANVVETLPAPLLDRLEVIYFPGYTEQEKIQISQHFLVPRQLREHALGHLGIEFTDAAVAKVIGGYTREAGLRNLEREIAMVCRKLARICVQSKGTCALSVDEELVEKFLGPRKFTHEVAEVGNQVGVTTGLVWTEFGGEIIFVEATRMRGHKQLHPHRLPGHRLAGVSPDRPLLYPQPRRGLRPGPGLLHRERHPHPPALRGHPQRRALRRGHHRPGPALPAHRPARPPGRGPDRRADPFRPHPAGERHQGEGPGGPAGRGQGGGLPQKKRSGYRQPGRPGQGGPGDRPGRCHRTPGGPGAAA